MHKCAFVALVIVSWSVGNLFMRGTVEVWSPVMAGLLSRLITVPLLLAWVVFRREGWPRLMPRGVVGWLLLMGVCAIVVNLLWFEAMAYTTATNVVMIFRLELVFVVLIGSVMGIERIRLCLVPVLALMLMGLALFVEVQNFDLGGHMLGDLMMVCAAVVMAANAFVIKHVLKKLDDEAVAFYIYAFSALGFLGFATFSGELLPTHLAFRSMGDWLWILSLGVIMAISLPLYCAALRLLEVWKFSTYMLTAPLMVAAIEWILWGLEFSALQCLGAAMVFAGLAFFIRSESHQKDIRCNPSTHANLPPASFTMQKTDVNDKRRQRTDTKCEIDITSHNVPETYKRECFSENVNI